LILFNKKILYIFVLISLIGCNAPPIPPEVKHAEEQDYILWRSGALQYMPQEYDQYKGILQKAKEDLIHEKSKYTWFRDYTFVQSEFREALQTGNLLLSQLEQKKQELSESIAGNISFFQTRINTLKGLTGMINEGRLAREDLIKAEVLLLEIHKRYEKNDFKAAVEKMNALSVYINAAENTLFHILNRYTDKNQIIKWQKWVDDTITESRKKRILSLVVNKSERMLTVYRNGVPYKSYEIGLGRNGSGDKLHVGDNATPEGRYKIIKKLPHSRYHKALLINYPNEDDQKQFLLAKKKGLVPQDVGIGGLIEIHGGGRDSMTYGCIAMDNRTIDELFSIVKVGTPVTIVGAVDLQNSLSSALKGL
jgi:lipoprotein-anchoring transpeptidase ErfK/SrfK